MSGLFLLLMGVGLGGMIVMRPDGTAIVDLLSRRPVWRERPVVSVRLPQ